MAEDRIIQIDSVDAYNKMYGWETLHPLVTVVNHTETLASLNHSRLNYGLYALFLKQGDGCSSRPACPSAKSPTSSASNIRSTSRACSSQELV